MPAVGGSRMVPASGTDSDPSLAQLYGYEATSFSPTSVSSAFAGPTNGEIQLNRFNLPADTPINNLWVYLGTAGVALTAGECFLGVYTIVNPGQAGAYLNFLCESADLSTVMEGAVGMKEVPMIGAPYSPGGGPLYIAQLFNWATSGPAFAAGSSQTLGLGQAGGPLTQLQGYPLTAALPGSTSLPATINLSATVLGVGRNTFYGIT